MEILKCQNLSKDFDHMHVIKDIQYVFRANLFYIIIGPSGSGKTTFLYLLSGLLEPTLGKVFFDNQDISSLTKSQKQNLRRNQIGFIFQEYHLISDLSVENNILLTYHMMNESYDHHFYEYLLKELDLKQKRNAYPHELSGGQKQRVAIARALIHKPKVIFADEPTGHLDTQNSLNVMRTLQKLKKENQLTLIMVTHNQDLCQYGDEIISIIDGRIQ